MPFTALFNESVTSGVVPEVLKISSAIPIHKSGLMSDAGNYRSISTLSPFSKIFEWLVYDQLLAFMEKENVLYQYRFGFRKAFPLTKPFLKLQTILKVQLIIIFIHVGSS